MIKWLERKPHISWLITIVIAIAIFYISSLTFPPGKGSFGYKPLIYHISAFFFFALFLSLALIKGKNKMLTIPAIIIGILYGISDEVHQLFVPGRHFSFGDIFLDSFGVVLALTMYIIYFEFRQKKLNPKYKIDT